MNRRQLVTPFPQVDFSTSGTLKHIRALIVSKFPLARLESLAFGLLWSVSGYGTWELLKHLRMRQDLGDYQSVLKDEREIIQKKKME